MRKVNKSGTKSKLGFSPTFFLLLFIRVGVESILTLCVSFSSKLKVINVFQKHIMKSKARDQSIQARKKLFCHVIVKNYLCNVLWKILIKIESTWRREIKEQAPQLTLLYRGRTVRSSHRRCCVRKLFLNSYSILNLQYPQETPGLESIFKKVTDLCNFIKNRHQHRCFPVNIAKFLILPVLKNICKRLLYNFFNGSLLHGPKDLRPRLYDGVGLQGPSHGSSFCF